MNEDVKRLVVIADLHCSHLCGLTHPGFDAEKKLSKHQHHYIQRREMWNWYERTMRELQPIDVLLVNGDCIEGKGSRSGGTELLTSDRDEQVEMAVRAIKVANADKIIMSYGTPYHTGADEDWEDAIAAKVSAEGIAGHGDADINGWIVNYKHYVNSSSVPYSRQTAIAKENLWNGLWAARDEYPRADIIIRSHVHYFGYVGNVDWLAITTPGLQGYNGKYGDRKMSGTVDVGLVYFDFPPKESGKSYTWTPKIIRFQKQEPLDL